MANEIEKKKKKKKKSKSGPTIRKKLAGYETEKISAHQKFREGEGPPIGRLQKEEKKLMDRRKRSQARISQRTGKSPFKQNVREFFGTKLAKGGTVKRYSTGGSVSRGQYPAQARKVKFKGVF